MLAPPVALIIFNRADLTARVFERIAAARPSHLLVIADGPRPECPSDVEKCGAARAVVERITWPCQVSRRYSDTNLGCGRGPASGIDWVFGQVEEAIILEDDCLPDPSFFPFCQELLERYRSDDRVMQICGNNFQFGLTRSRDSYFFSHHNICWGWASWRRAWRHFDLQVTHWPALRETGWLSSIAEHPAATRHWQEVFDLAHARRGNVDFWDFQWTFACWAQNGLSILPATTLVENIGFGGDATHTTNVQDPRANNPAERMRFPLRHPPCLARNVEADRIFIEKVVLPQLAPGAAHRTWRDQLLGRMVSKALRSFRLTGSAQQS